MTATAGANSQVNGALEFSRQPGSVAFADPACINLAEGDFTFEIIFCPKPSAVDERQMLLMKGSAIQLLLDCGIDAGKLICFLKGSGVSEVRALTAKPVNSGEWTYAALVRQGDNLLIYVNGELQVQVSGLSGLDLTNSAKLLVGHHVHWQTAPDNAFVGAIDEVRLSDSAKSSEQIKANWQKFSLNELTLAEPITAAAEPEAVAQAQTVPSAVLSSQFLADFLADPLLKCYLPANGLLGSQAKRTEVSANRYIFSEGGKAASGAGVKNDSDGAYLFRRDPDSYLTADGSAFEFGTADFSFGFWFLAEGIIDETRAMLVKQRTNSPYLGYLATLTADGKVTFTYNGGGGIDVRSPGAYLDGQWHQVVCVRQGDNLYLYIDGALASQKTGAKDKNADNGCPLVIGHHSHFGKAADNAFAGKLDNVFLIGRALSESEVQALDQAGAN